MRRMIYTIGYAGWAPTALHEHVLALGATLVDVRIALNDPGRAIAPIAVLLERGPVALLCAAPIRSAAIAALLQRSWPNALAPRLGTFSRLSVRHHQMISCGYRGWNSLWCECRYFSS